MGTLSRFISPQRQDFQNALSEIKSGRKSSHWMWYIFPQIEGLGRTETSKLYSIKNLREARAFLQDSFLSSNLREITGALLLLKDRTASEIFGFPDDRKLQSSMTLFSLADGTENNIFEQVLIKFFNGEKCSFTVRAVATED